MKESRTVSVGWKIVFLSGALAGGASAQVQEFTCPGGFLAPPAPPPALKSLKTATNPVLPGGALRADLGTYIANKDAAIRLGKALFWDMQAGSDNKVACATCHFQAGGDNRTRNQLNPGANGSWDGYGVNFNLTAAAFPFTTPSADTDSVAGSQGIRRCSFGGITGSGAEVTTTLADPVFNSGGVNTRQATGKNSPSVIDAVFNHRNFWNSRAQPEFNGVNPWGNRDANARIWTVNASIGVVQAFVRIPNASLASQAVGPPLSDVEMSAVGRTFPELGRKLLRSRPLGLQRVDPKDGVLGKLADTRAGKGLTTTYAAMIQAAFQSPWWNSTSTVPINGKSYSLQEANFSFYWGLAIMLYEATLVANDSPMDQFLAGRTFDPVTGALTQEGKPLLLNNVATRLATDYGYSGGTAGIQNGLKLFEQPLPPAGTGRECIACHAGANLTSASVASIVEGIGEPGTQVFKAAGFDLRIERMFMQVPPVPEDLFGRLLGTPGAPAWFTDTITFDPATYAVTATHISGTPPVPAPVPAPVTAYDLGWYNLGVRPPAEDPGLGGTDLSGNPLSWVELFQQTLSDPGVIRIPGGTLPCAGAGNANFPNQLVNANGFPILSGPLRRTEATDSLASFKTPPLRNVELSGPYLHNGGKSTLRQVVEFYDDGGDFPARGDPSRGAGFPSDRRSPLMKFYGDLSDHGLGLTVAEVKDLVAFMLSLTDERVRWERAPFDHPQLFVPEGDVSPGTDSLREIPAVGAGGRAVPVKPFLNLNPFAP